MVMCNTRMLDETSLRPIGSLRRVPPREGDNLFYDLLVERNAPLAPSAYMVRTSAFLDVNPQRHIYESRAGQNWQMLLPLAYRYRCGYIDEYLYDYVVRRDSHSRQARSKEELLARLGDHEDILGHVIDEMNIESKHKYLELVRVKYIRRRLSVAIRYRDIDLLEEQYRLLESSNAVRTSDFIGLLRGKYPIVGCMYNSAVYLVRAARAVKRLPRQWIP
jgi:hypothetical protein